MRSAETTCGPPGVPRTQPPRRGRLPQEIGSPYPWSAASFPCDAFELGSHGDREDVVVRARPESMEQHVIPPAKAR